MVSRLGSHSNKHKSLNLSMVDVRQDPQNTSKETKSTNRKLNEQIALLESKKQSNVNITVHVLDNNNLDVKEEDAHKIRSSQNQKGQESEDGQSDKADKRSQPTMAYTGKSKSVTDNENLTTSKNSVFRLTHKDHHHDLGQKNMSQTSGFARIQNQDLKNSGNEEEEFSATVVEKGTMKGKTMGDGFGLKSKKSDTEERIRNKGLEI